MSTTYIAIVVMVLSKILPEMGVSVGSDSLTTTVTTIIAIGAAVWGFYGRYRAGGISALGFRI